MDFYKDVLNAKYDIEVIIPPQEDRERIHNVIYDELVLGTIQPESKKVYQSIIESSIENGAQGVILRCTEIPLLIKAHDVNIPIFDTTRIHAESVVEFVLK